MQSGRNGLNSLINPFFRRDKNCKFCINTPACLPRICLVLPMREEVSSSIGGAWEAILRQRDFPFPFSNFGNDEFGSQSLLRLCAAKQFRGANNSLGDERSGYLCLHILASLPHHHDRTLTFQGSLFFCFEISFAALDHSLLSIGGPSTRYAFPMSETGIGRKFES